MFPRPHGEVHTGLHSPDNVQMRHVKDMWSARDSASLLANHAHLVEEAKIANLRLFCRRMASLLGGGHVAKLLEIVSSSWLRRFATRQSLSGGIGDIYSGVCEMSRESKGPERLYNGKCQPRFLRDPYVIRYFTGTAQAAMAIVRWNRPRSQRSAHVHSSPTEALFVSETKRGLTSSVGPDS